MLLEKKNKWDTSRRFLPGSTVSGSEVTSPGAIKEAVFTQWANVNMYRTSYNDMSNRVSEL